MICSKVRFCDGFRMPAAGEAMPRVRRPRPKASKGETAHGRGKRCRGGYGDLRALPKGLHRIRHYGLFAKSCCADNIARARELLAVSNSQWRMAWR